MPTRLSADISWSKPNKFIFRFIWIYTLLYTFPFPFNFLPFGQYITQWTDQFWKWLALPVARHLFHITDNLTLQGRGSGDTSLDYIIIFILLTMALVAALIWTLTDRKHNHYNTLFRYQVVYLRYYTALNLFVYAIVKIFPTQFWERPDPVFRRAITYGIIMEIYGIFRSLRQVRRDSRSPRLHLSALP